VIGCFDSDVLIDYFNGIPAAAEELSRYERVLISRITWMEVLVGAPTQILRQVREDFLAQFTVIELNERVAREAITLRRTHRLKLPDAIIWASARLNHALFVTRNAKDFDRREPDIRIPYGLT
jgi:predicted nucleic acid-binding protein